MKNRFLVLLSLVLLCTFILPYGVFAVEASEHFPVKTVKLHWRLDSFSYMDDPYERIPADVYLRAIKTVNGEKRVGDYVKIAKDDPRYQLIDEIPGEIHEHKGTTREFVMDVDLPLLPDDGDPSDYTFEATTGVRDGVPVFEFDPNADVPGSNNVPNSIVRFYDEDHFSFSLEGTHTVDFYPGDTTARGFLLATRETLGDGVFEIDGQYGIHQVGDWQFYRDTPTRAILNPKQDGHLDTSFVNLDGTWYVKFVSTFTFTRPYTDGFIVINPGFQTIVDTPQLTFLKNEAKYTTTNVTDDLGHLRTYSWNFPAIHAGTEVQITFLLREEYANAFRANFPGHAQVYFRGTVSRAYPFVPQNPKDPTNLSDPNLPKKDAHDQDLDLSHYNLVAFTADHGGTLRYEGKSVPAVSFLLPKSFLFEDMRELLPTPVPNAGYVFQGWTPALPASTDHLQHGAVYVAQFAKEKTPSTPSPAPEKPLRIEIGDFGPVVSSPLPTTSKLPVEEHIHKAYLFGYPDNTIRPDGDMTRAEAAAMLSRLMELPTEETTPPRFTDTNSPGAWYHQVINAVVKAGLMKGYPDGSFRPDAPITRAEFAQMILSVDQKSTGDVPFPDVKDHWAEAAISQGYANGRLVGYPDGFFHPDRMVTRAEATKVLNSLFQRMVRQEGLLGVQNPEALKVFSDLTPDHWAYYEVVEAANTHSYERLHQRGIEEKWVRILPEK